ncbi:hypothetical protein [Bacillus thuringiensis]|uniref:hypothetical protein n=1 Tax=Bacillus thuringiensis TaxID=1428 RepID=UPI0021000BDA|nr:hypothetical protein [Bacillus thuringiensis]
MKMSNVDWLQAEENTDGIQTIAMETDESAGIHRVVGYNGILKGEVVEYDGNPYTVVMVSRLGHMGLSETGKLPYTLTAMPKDVRKLPVRYGVYLGDVCKNVYNTIGHAYRDAEVTREKTGYIYTVHALNEDVQNLFCGQLYKDSALDLGSALEKFYNHFPEEWGEILLEEAVESDACEGWYDAEVTLTKGLVLKIEIVHVEIDGNYWLCRAFKKGEAYVL